VAAFGLASPCPVAAGQGDFLYRITLPYQYQLPYLVSSKIPYFSARTTGLEPATTGSTVRYSNQLSYVPNLLKMPPFTLLANDTLGLLAAHTRQDLRSNASHALVILTPQARPARPQASQLALIMKRLPVQAAQFPFQCKSVFPRREYKIVLGTGSGASMPHFAT
jgi:hypothetical protein